MRKFLLLGAASAALSFSGPVRAQEDRDASETSIAGKGANELGAFSKMFGNMFPKDDTPIAPALLAKSQRVAEAIVPAGSYRKIMAGTFQQIIEPMMAGMDDIPLSTIAGFAGVNEEDIKLEEGATLSDLMIIIDPYYKQRNRAMMTRITDILIDMSDDMEPPIRTGLARAYARRFSADELEAAAQFYETEPGAKIAGESLAIFASPEVMSASMEMMPKFMERLMGVIGEIAEGSGDLPPRRSFDELSEEERGRMAELMGVDRESLGGSGEHGLDEMEEDAAEAVGMNNAWDQPENWSAKDRALVEKLNAESDSAFEEYYDALESATEAARMRLKKD